MKEPESKDHHYVPVFLLSRFASQTEPAMLQAYSWNTHKDQLWCVPKAPKAVCYKPRLYSTPSHPERPDELERGLFGDLDMAASRITEKLTQKTGITNEEREHLLRFLFSLDARRPAVIEAARLYGPSRMAAMLDTDPVLIRALREHNVKMSPSEFAFSDDDLAIQDRIPLNLMDGLINRPKFANVIRSAAWAVKHLGPGWEHNPFALSDRPLVRVRGIDSNFVWALPLAPNCLLVLAARQEDMDQVASLSDKQLVNAMNSDSVLQSDRYVFWSGTVGTGWLARRFKARASESRQTAQELAARIGWNAARQSAE